jgi:hypothetical protein
MMAAGLGFKTFTTGEVLTAGDVNGYLMQGINVFATTTARNAAITAPAEGQFAFTKDTNSLWYYDGAVWVASGATGDIEGVTAGVGISGGGTSGTVTVTNSMATAIDAKGDLVPGTGADTFSRLAVGANDTVLTADSSTATGLKWATVASGSQTSIASGSLSGSSVTLSSISSSYRDLKLVITNFRPSADLKLMMRFNGATSGYRATPGTFTGSVTFADTEMFISTTADGGASSQSLIIVDIPEYANTVAWKIMTYNSLVNNETTNTNGAWEQNAGLFKSTSAISSITLLPQAGGTFTTGDYVLYGVK